MPIASGNSVPMQAGGSPTRYEKAYSALQRMVGRNGFSIDDDEIEALWRQAKADAMAALETFDERAALQAFPSHATDHIPLYEDILGLETDVGLSDEQRRDIIVPDYTGVPEAWTTALAEALQRIDPAVTIITRNWENGGTCEIGRWYEPFDGSDTYDQNGDRIATAWPNPSDMHAVIVQYDIGNGIEPNREQLRLAEQMRAHLNEVCPAWVEHHIIYAAGFFLDQSRLDATAFGT
jgi:hypothetical protein